MKVSARASLVLAVALVTAVVDAQQVPPADVKAAACAQPQAGRGGPGAVAWAAEDGRRVPRPRRCPQRKAASRR